MLLVLSGPSAVGKSFCVDFLCTRYNFKTVVPFTSRPPRITEAEGVHYHFRCKEDLQALSQNFSVGYWGTPLDDNNFYGYTAELDDLITQQHHYVIQASTDLAARIKDKHSTRHKQGQVILGFLNFQSDTALEHKVQERFGNNSGSTKAPASQNGEVARRLKHARHEISRRNEFDFTIAANDPFATAHLLVEQLIGRYYLELPSRLAPPLYGALSDVDILNSLNEPDGIRFYNVDKAKLSEQVHGWSVDLTLGERYWKIRADVQQFDLALGDDEELEKRFEKCKATLDTGIVLHSGEIILSVTHEHLQLPKGIVGIFAGRTSYANVGISIELSQIILQPGHNSPVRLQIRNNLPYSIRIYPGMRLVQAVFFRLHSPASRKYIERLEAHYKTPDDVISKYYSDPVLQQLREVRQQRVKPFPWSAALELAQITAGFSAVCTFVGLV